MLCLSRKAGETIVIDERLTLRVLEISRNGVVKLGFDGAPEVQVRRSEIPPKQDKVTK